MDRRAVYLDCPLDDTEAAKALYLDSPPLCRSVEIKVPS